MWDKKKLPTAQTKENMKKMRKNCICKITKVGKDLVFNLGDGGTDLIVLTTNYLQLKNDKGWEEKAKEWKSGGIWEGVDRLKIRNMKKKLTPTHEVALGALKLKIDTKDKNRDLGKVLRIVRDMTAFEKQTETSGEFF
jgi:hypothetical protein